MHDFAFICVKAHLPGAALWMAARSSEGAVDPTTSNLSIDDTIFSEDTGALQ